MKELVPRALTVLVSAFIGSYLGPYLKRKGQNLATHEDIDKLVDQVRAVTTTTKEIEAKISNDVWDRQKRWELKRDVLFEMMKRTGALTHELANLHAVYQTDKEAIKRGEPGRLERQAEASKTWGKAASEFDNTALLVNLVCGKELKKVLAELSLFNRNVGLKLLNRQIDALEETMDEFVAKLQAVTAAVQAELNTDKRS